MLVIFESIVRMSLEASLVVLAVLLMRLLLKASPKKYSYALWSVVLFRMCCPVSFKSSFSIGGFVKGITSLFQETGAGNSIALQSPQAPVTENVITSVTTTPPVTTLPEEIVTTPAVPQINVPADTVEALSFGEILPYVFAVVWAVGVASMLILGLASYIKVRRSTKGTEMVEAGVYEGESIPSPFVLGYIRPRIFVPRGLDTDTLFYVVTHEKTHLNRYDHVIKALYYIALSVHWFNPLCWLAFALMSRDMEMSCDEKVLSKNEGSGKEYSMALLKIASFKKRTIPAPVGFGEVGVKGRITHALKYKKPKAWVTVISLLLCIVTMFGCASDAEIGNAEQTTENVQSGENVTPNTEDAGESGLAHDEKVIEQSLISALDDAVTRVFIEEYEEKFDSDSAMVFDCESHYIAKTIENEEENTVSVLVLLNYLKTYNARTEDVSDYKDMREAHFMKFSVNENGYELVSFDGILGGARYTQEIIDTFGDFFPEGGSSEFTTATRKILFSQVEVEWTPYRFVLNGKPYEMETMTKEMFFEILISDILDSDEDYADPEGYITENREVFDNLVQAPGSIDFLIGEFLKGGNDGLRGFVMYRALSEYMANNKANEFIDEAFDYVPLDENGRINGQLYFDTLLKHVLDLTAEYGGSQLSGKYPTWAKISSAHLSSLSNEELMNFGSPYPVPDAITVHHNGEKVTFRKGEGKYYDIYRFNMSLLAACDKTLNSDVPMNGYKMTYLCDTPDYESLINKYSVFEIETYPYIEYVYDDGTLGCIFAARGGAILVPLMDAGEEPLYAAYRGWIHHGSMGELLESCFE